MEAGVDFVAVDFPEANRLTIHILAAVAEHEAKIVSERTKDALARAKARGVRLGGDRGHMPSIAPLGAAASVRVRQDQAKRRAADFMGIITEIEETGATSGRQIATALNDRGIPAIRGGTWSAIQVKRLLDRKQCVSEVATLKASCSPKTQRETLVSDEKNSRSLS
jgi:DNA invertase Pin-like site-specific DNA recombinase